MRVPYLLQSPDIGPVPHHVNGEAMPETMRVHVLANHRSMPLHQLPSPLPGYGEGAHRSRCYVWLGSHAAQPAYHVKREPPLLAALRLHDIDHVVVVFDVLGPQVQQFIDPDSRAP